MQLETHLRRTDFRTVNFICAAGCILGRRTGRFRRVFFFNTLLFLAVRAMFLHDMENDQYGSHY